MRWALALLLTLSAGTGVAPAGTQVDDLLPERAVARVDEQLVLRERQRHWQRIARQVESGVTRRRARREAMSFLIAATWLTQETRARGIRVTREQVRRAFTRQRREAFDSRRAYRRWLRRTGQTEADVRYRVKLDLLSAAVRRQVLRGVPRDSQRTRLRRFTRRFERRYRALTYCRKGFRVRECRNR
jgi:SurA-like N-terminal domain